MNILQTTYGARGIQYGYAKYGDADYPTLTLSTSEPTPTNDSPILFTANFDQPVWNFRDTSIVFTAGHGTISGFEPVSGSISPRPSNPLDGYTGFQFYVNPSSQGTITISVANGSCWDSSGVDCVGDDFTVSFDNVGPSLLLTSSQVVSNGTTSVSPIPFELTITEATSQINQDIMQGDISVTSGATISNFTKIDSMHYSFDLTPTSIKNYSINIAAGVIEDAAGNSNTAAPQFEFTYSGGEITGDVSGIRSSEVWSEVINLTGNVIIPNSVTVFVDTDTTVYSNGYVIIVQDGGKLDTKHKRLSRKSNIRSTIAFT
jgi:hypothetical protein